MSASTFERRRARRIEHAVEAQVELQELLELMDRLETTLAAARAWSQRHHDTLRTAAGELDRRAAIPRGMREEVSA